MMKKKNVLKNNYNYDLLEMNDTGGEKTNNYDAPAFNYKSIHNYSSIYKFSPQLHRNEIEQIYGETKSLNFAENFINYSILGFFYILFLLTFPLSLFVCLKHVKKNEKFVVYRLGRLIQPAYETGYYILFPLIDNYQRYTITQKEFTLPNLQIFTSDNGIVELNIHVNYFINDVIKAENTLQNLNHSIKSLTRSLLIEYVSKKSANKIEMELYYIKAEVKRDLNENIRKWGVSVSDIEVTILSVTEDETNKNGDDGALKSLQLVFKSLFNSTSSPTMPSNGAQPNAFTQTLMSFMQPTIQQQQQQQPIEIKSNSIAETIQTEQIMTPEQLLTLIEPLVNESLVNEIQTLYEFHIKSENEDQIKRFFVNLKYNQGSVGHGNYLIQNSSAKVDCCIKVNEKDLNEILLERLSPLNAYMSGRIEIDGNLNDVLKLKKILTSSISLAMKK